MFSKGNKEIIEKNFRNLIVSRDIPKTSKNFFKVYSFKKNKANTWTSKFQSFFYEIIPYVFLKSKRKRKGNFIKYKVNYMERSKGQRKALSAFSSMLYSKSIVSKSFVNRFQTELDKLFNSNAENQKSTNSINEKVMEIHRQAYKSMPYSWLKKK